MANKPGLLSGKGGWHRDINGGISRTLPGSIGMKTSGGRTMDRSGGKARVAKASEQPSKKDKSTNPKAKRTSGFVR